MDKNTKVCEFSDAISPILRAFYADKLEKVQQFLFA